MIVVEHLSKSYGAQQALDGITFSALPGQVSGFLGPNGAGKSTTMKLISGFLKPDQGKVEICGINMATNSMEAKRLLGYLPENNPLYLDLYVKEALEFMADIHQIEHKKNRIAQVIEQTGLGPEQYKKIGMLSKGFRQRVGLAQAIIHDPQVLILDEPSSGLDPNQALELRELIKSLAASKTVLFSTHQLQEVEAICEQVLVISQGKLVANQSKNSLLTTHPGKTLAEVFTQLTCN